MTQRSAILTLALAIAFSLAVNHGAAETNPNMTKQVFGKTADGTQVDIFTLKNKGMEVSITNYGGTVVSVKVPDRKGHLEDVVLGYENLDGYVADKAYLGATVGRYGNRIAKGKFSLDGTTYTLAKNNGENSLHGGTKGFNKAIWEAKDVSTKQAPALQLSYLSKDGEEGYPGNLSVQVTFTLTEEHELKIQYSATTDKDTVLNLTNHSYFNLAGAGIGDVMPTLVMINADRFVPVDSKLIPTGELRSVQGTPFDFRTPVAIGARIDQDNEQLKFGGGYDVSWVVNNGGGQKPVLAAKAHEPKSGRTLEVWTTEPGIQFYTGNSLDGTIHGKGGHVYNRRYAFCFEAQHFPDSPNHPQFPTTELKPGQKFHSETIYKFSAK